MLLDDMRLTVRDDSLLRKSSLFVGGRGGRLVHWPRHIVAKLRRKRFPFYVNQLYSGLSAMARPR